MTKYSDKMTKEAVQGNYEKLEIGTSDNHAFWETQRNGEILLEEEEGKEESG